MHDGFEAAGKIGAVAAEQAGLPADAAGTPPWPLSERPGFLARRLHQIHVSLFAERCADFRITPLQYSLLSRLAEFGEFALRTDDLDPAAPGDGCGCVRQVCSGIGIAL